MKKLLLSLAVIALAGPALAQDTKPTIVTPDDLKWAQNPAVPKGVEGATISGDPTKAGSVVMQRVRIAPDVLIPPHTHPYDEVVTLISGNLIFGMGEKVDPSTAPIKSGTLIINPAKNPHYVKNGAEVSILQVQFVAPGGIDYLNPTDDPRKK